MSEHKQLVPKLRFPDFQDGEEWRLFYLGDVANFFNGKGLPKSSITDKGNKPCIHYGELFTKYSEVIDKVEFRTDQKENFLSLDNDVLMPTSDVTPNGLAKASCIRLNNVVLGGGILIIRTNKSEINGEYLSRYIRHEKQQVLRYVTGVTVYHLYSSSISKLLLSKPKLKEQQKIAECLSSIDESISTQTSKLNALQNHKKALMQKLFPAESKTTPRLRFPEFRNEGEWEGGCVSDIAKITKGKAIKNSKDLVCGKYPVIAGGKTSPYNHFAFTHENVVTVSSSGAYAGYVSYHPYKIWASDCSVVATEDSNIKYIFYMLSHLQYKIYSLQSGGAQPHVYPKEVEILRIRIPLLEEQQKIADCLSSIDELITAQAEKIDMLQTHKKGLMQQLFPTADKMGT